MAAGTVAGLLALNEKSVVDDSCHGTACSPAGKDAADTGKAEALVSTVSFGVGLGALATLAVLLLVDGGSHSARAPRAIGLSGRSLLVGVSF
jgi:hypothetical protein